MSNCLHISNVRPWGGEPVDVVVENGLVTDVASPADCPTLDGHGRIILPAFSDVHLHLDSSCLGLPFRTFTGEPGRWGRIMNDRENWRSAGRSVADRASFTLAVAVANGATRIRTHAQVDADSKLEKFEGVLAARERYADVCDVQIVAFPQVGILLEPGVVDLLDASLRAGADLIGGIDPCEIDRDPVRHLDAVFGLAEKHQVDVDIHLHEAGELGLFTTALILERVEALGMQGRVTISHARALCSGLPGVGATIDRIAANDVAITHAAGGGGWELPLAQLAAAGVRVGVGMDGQRDYWSPYGNSDMLDRAWQLAFTQGYRSDPEVEHALAVATWGGASVLDRNLLRLREFGAHPGFAVGDPAEFVLLDSVSPTAAVMDRPAERTVIHRGAVISVDTDIAGFEIPGRWSNR
ncbi:amidohydrolase family protein [Nocardia camponoti]|uniref:Cytosine deaminase n=1 Tax=Nocardia camponoti TaxID=1616106 RepID=A0A917QQD1_9NOCA|nr:amidohydrolase family protein [Nocardia camponoti]GGK61875.1 cytosine deaminase [Nocardia camponoti]